MLGTYALMGLPVSVPLLVAAGCGAALVYGADRVLVAAPEDRWNRPDRVAWVQAHRRWLMGEGMLLAVAGGGALLLLRPSTIAGAVLLGGMAGLHQWRGGGFRLRATGGTAGLGKPLVIAAVWAVGSTALPMVEAGAVRPGPLGWLVGYRTLFVLPNVLLSDWGDRRGDRAAGLDPWSRRVRAKDLRWSVTAVLLMAVGLAGGGVVVGVPPGLVLVDAIGPMLLLGGVWTLTPEASAHRLVLDLIVAWPAVTAAVAWGIG